MLSVVILLILIVLGHLSVLASLAGESGSVFVQLSQDLRLWAVDEQSA